MTSSGSPGCRCRSRYASSRRHSRGVEAFAIKLTKDTMCAVSTRSSVDIASLAFTRARGLSSRRRIPQNLWGNGRNGILRLYPCSSVHKKHAETTIETAFSKWHCVQTIASEYVASYRTMYKHVCHMANTRNHKKSHRPFCSAGCSKRGRVCLCAHTLLPAPPTLGHPTG